MDCSEDIVIVDPILILLACNYLLGDLKLEEILREYSLKLDAVNVLLTVQIVGNAVIINIFTSSGTGHRSTLGINVEFYRMLLKIIGSFSLQIGCVLSREDMTFSDVDVVISHTT